MSERPAHVTVLEPGTLRAGVAASGGPSGPRREAAKSPASVLGDISDPHLEAISRPAHTPRRISPRFTVFHVLPRLRWLTFPLRGQNEKQAR